MCKSYLILLHHRQTPLKVFQPCSRGSLDITLLDGRDALVGTAKGEKAIAEFGILFEILAVVGHAASEKGSWIATLLVVEEFIATTNPLDVGSH